MKHLILVIAFVICGTMTQAQVYSEEKGEVVNLNELDINYIDIGAWMNFMQTKIKNFRIDYGQPMGLYGDKLTDETGEPLGLRSVAQMLNHFDKNGWDLYLTNVVANDQTSMTHYIFKRRKE